MITTVYFVRHAEPDYSIEEDAIRPLSEKGMKDAQQLPKFFSGIVVDKIVSSPFKRAYDTVRPLSEERGMAIELVDRLCERKVSGGGWIRDFRAFAMNQWADFDYRLDGGECLRAVQERNIDALEEIVTRYNGKNIVVGSHGTALSTIINHYDKKFGYEDFNEIKGVMPWIVKFIFEDNKTPIIETLNV